MLKKLFSLFAALTLSVGLWAAAPANAESVDLGLPSGLKWANMNVGATAPEGYGDYFAWGETAPYYNTPITDPLTWKTGKESGYSWASYFDTKDGGSTFQKYNLTGGKTTLEPEDDAAHVNWGGNWRMPTKAEQEELRTECNWDWTNDYNGTGIKGYIVSSKKNKKSIFLPASGNRYDSSLHNVGSSGYYWSSSLSEYYSYNAYYLYFNSVIVDWISSNRYYGRSVRPVCK